MRQLDIKLLKDKLSDRWWRLNNLYYIKDQDGNKVLFKPENRIAQKMLYENMWFFNIVPKARQLGCCLAPDTRVLTAELKWVKMSALEVGTKIISVDEDPLSQGKGRRMKTGVVEAKKTVRRPSYRITFDDGREVVCSNFHPWLSKSAVQKHYDWRAVENYQAYNENNPKFKKKRLKVGSQIRSITKPWGDSDFEDGWFGGMIDGEGSLANKKRLGGQVTVAQRQSETLDAMKRYLEREGYNYRVEVDKRKIAQFESGTTDRNHIVEKVVVSRMNEMFRLLGKTQPKRFKGIGWWEGREMPVNDNVATIVKIEDIGEHELVDLQVSTGTYIAEGLVSHNTTFFTIFYLDQILFSSNKTATIIAHGEKYMKDIFRDKVKFAWDNLHPWLKKTLGEPNTDSANELTFPNGSMISVSLSSRGRTVNFLHISEFGKICAKYPHKAKEIVTGAINSVHPGNFVSIESTAEGRDGYFYDFCMEAEKNRREGRELTPLDFKIFFFPWWIDPRYSMEDKNVVLSKEDEDYFKSLKEKDGIDLTEGQKRYYVKKKALNQGDMYQEYPSSLEECFKASIEGQVFADEMKMLYNENRIGVVQYDPNYEVDTWWDLGWSDFTVILCTQYIGGQIRFIDMHWNRRKPLEHYYDWLKERKQVMGYRYGAHHLPHDAAVTDLNEGKSREETLYKLGLVNIRIGKKVDIMEGIDRVRGLATRFYIDESKCKKFADSMFNYRYEYDPKLGFDKKKPLHDVNSHFIDPCRLMPQFLREERAYATEYEREIVEKGGDGGTAFFG